MAELQRGAIYCWVPVRRDPGQTTVAEQERLGRREAAALGIEVSTRHVFVDAQLSAWANGATPSGWRQLIAAAQAHRFRHLFLHRAERLDALPHALLQLLATAAELHLVVHGHRLDLNDPRVRDAELARARGACEARNKASLQARSAHHQAAVSGRAHGGGLRPYGYAPGMTEPLAAEVAVVREIYSRYLHGDTRRAIALDLNRRSVPTATGKAWTVSGITRILDAPRYAGLRVQRGQVVRTAAGEPVTATWEPCVSLETWQTVRHRRREESESDRLLRAPARFYPLTSLAWCTRCERGMVGSILGSYPTYVCSSSSYLTPGACTRRISAERLEDQVIEEAIRLLEAMDDTDPVTDLTTTYPHAASGPGGRAVHRAVSTRPTDALEGVVTGPRARFGWNRLTVQRKAQVLRHLFTVVRISATTASRNTFDPNRVRAIPRSLRTTS